MSSKKDMGLRQMFNLITDQGLSPNQFYMLCGIQEGISPVHINQHQELRSLQTDGWITKEAGGWSINPKGMTLIQQVSGYFKTQKKKTSVQLMGSEFATKLEEYQLLFPKIKLPSGKAARSAVSNVETNFRWFFEKHTYSWDTVLKATAYYVDEFESKGYLYMRTSAYFIRKTEQDKSIVSDLAEYCSIVESGEDLESGNAHFSEKVV
jgi:hypothetical protein